MRITVGAYVILLNTTKCNDIDTDQRKRLTLKLINNIFLYSSSSSFSFPISGLHSGFSIHFGQTVPLSWLLLQMSFATSKYLLFDEADITQSCWTKLTLESMPEAEGKLTTDIIMSKRQEDAI